MPSTPSSAPPPVPLPPALRRQLGSWRLRLGRQRLGEWAFHTFSAASLWFLAVWVSDRFWDSMTAGRLVGWALLMSVAGFGLAWVAYRWWFRFQNPLHTGHYLRGWNRRVGDQVLAALELTGTSDSAAALGTSPALREAAVTQLAEKLATASLAPATEPQRLQRASTRALSLALVTGALWLVAPEASWNAAHRALIPWSPVERYTFVQLEALPSSLVIPHGESTTLKVSLREDSLWKRSHATTHLTLSGQKQSAERQGLDYHFNLPGVLQTQSLRVTVGDATHAITLIPKHRPGLEKLTATIVLPDYLQHPPRSLDIADGVVSSVIGSQVTLTGTTLRPLARAELRLASRVPLTIDGARFRTAPLSLEATPQIAEFHWEDEWGLTPKTPTRVRLLGENDQPPQTEILADTLATPALLPNDTVTLALRAQDDFGVHVLGYLWGHPADDPLSLWQTQSRPLQEGTAQATTLDHDLSFSPSAHQLAPGNWQVWAYARDYRPGKPPTFSRPQALQVLTEEQHASLIRAQFRHLQEELETVTQREAQLKQQNEGLAASPTPDANALARQAQAEQATAEALQSLAEQTGSLLQEAMKNASLDNQALKQWGDMLGAMNAVAQEGMPQAAQSLSQAQAAASAGQAAASTEALQQAIAQQEKNLQQLAEAMGQGQETEEALEAATFITRFRKAASDEEGVATKMKVSFFQSAGLTPEQLGATGMEALDQLQHHHEDTREEVSYLMNDLKHYHRRTQKAVFGAIHQQMLTSQVPAALTDVTTRVQRNQHGRVIEGALALASQFHAWADALSEAKQKAKDDPSSQEGSGESPGQGNEKLMLSLMRLLQREMTLRDQTRAADQLKEDAAHHAQVAAGLAADQRDIAFSVASLLARLMDPNLQQRLRGAAEAMDDAAALLERAETGGETIAAETDAIERLAQAAKASGQMGGQSKTVNALAEVLAMMEVGNSPGGNDSGESSSLASRASEGAMGEDGREARTIGKTSGRVAGDFPEEFREALGHFFEAREALRSAPPQP